ncbi:TPA: phage tail protein [Yersinia enterocolitica]|nr:phage tail protein [Yersinia enterocolitica]
MDRQIVYPGAIPLETDLLNTNRFTMIAIAKLAASVMGSNTYLNGLACTASSPASMVINIAPGEIYSLQNIDSAAYSSLPADTTHSILKQGIVLNTTSFTLAAPSTAGQSINYLIQVAFQDIDSGATVLPYYNASNPAQAYSGPNNSGIAQNTIRSGVCSVSVKTGVSATTGSQVTPSPDAGYVGAYVVTVNQGQTTITSTSINFAANAPFLPKNGLVSGVQSNTLNYSTDTGTANAYAASYSPAVTQLTDGLRLTFKAKNNNTSSSTFSPNGISSAPIYTRSAGILTGGEIGQNKIIEVEWNSTLNAWTLISGSDPLAVSALQKANNLSEIAAAGSVAQAAAQANIGVTGGLGASVIGRLIAKRSITSTGVIPKATGAKWAIIRAWSAGGGGGGAGRTVTAGNASQGWAGQSGSFIEVLVDVSGLSNYDCSIGLGGTGGAASNVNAGNPGLDGGSTIIAGILSCPGGKGGQPGVLGTTNNTGIAIIGTALPTATLGTILDSSVSDIGAPGSQVGTGPNQSLGCRGGSAPGGLGSVGGQAGRPIDAGTDGTGGDGKGHAAGGGGGSSVSNTTGYGGGNGTGGFISITEFA